MIAESLPADLAAAHAMILAERAARLAAEAGLAEARAEAVGAKADLTGTEALIAHLKLAIEKLLSASMFMACCHAWGY